MHPRLLLPLLCLAAITANGQPLPALIPYTDGAKWGYADTTGTVRIAPQWDEARFFHDNRAEVLLRPDTAKPYYLVHCIIDRLGHYIVPPSAGWSGLWMGWARTRFNAVESTGHAGLIDTVGNVLLPYAWEGSGYEVQGPQQDSFKIVSRGGLQGVINRRGEVVISPVWRFIQMDYSYGLLNAALVTDPDNKSSYNNKGLVNMHNETILPPHYESIIPVALPGGRQLLFLTTLVYDTRKKDFLKKEQTMERIGGHFVPVGDTARRSYDPSAYEIPQPGGYILFAKGSTRGLMDATRRVVVPCCVWWVNADTIFLRDEKLVGKDSALCTITFLNAKTLQPLAAPRTLVLYHEQPRQQQQGYLPHPHRYIAPATIPIRDVGYVHWLYKDTMLYWVQEHLPDGKGGVVYNVYGGKHTGPREGRMTAYSALLDSNGAYVIPPIANYQITAWDAATGILTVSGSSSRYRQSGATLLDRQGGELMRPQRTDLAGGFHWRGQLYARAIVQERLQPHNPYDEGDLHVVSVTIIDTSGQPLSALAQYNVALPGEFTDMLARLPEGSIAVRDSSGRVGIVTPDGKVLLPGLSFKYRDLKAVGKSWTLAMRTEGKPGRLMDEEGRTLLNGLPVYDAVPARTYSKPFGNYSTEDLVVPRLYRITAQGAAGQSFSFYLDDKGRTYLKGVR